MAYTTGTVDSYLDILAKLRSAAIDQGWSATTADSARNLFLTNPAGNAFFSFRAFPQGASEVPWYNQSPGNGSGEAIAVIGNTGFDVGLEWNKQPGNSIDNGSLLNRPTILRLGHSGPYAKYHIFATPVYLHMVIEIVTGMFGHLFVGNLVKDGTTYQGGQYTAASFYFVPPVPDVGPGEPTGSNWLDAGFSNYPFSHVYPQYATSKVRVDNVDGNGVNYWLSGRIGNGNRDPGTFIGMGTALGSPTYGSQGHPDALLVAASRNSIDSSTQLIPHAMYFTGAQQRARYIGNVPDHCVCDMDYLSPGSVVTFGADQWMVFPAYRKGPYLGINNAGDVGVGAQQLYNSSLTMGYAFKVNS